MCGSYTKIAQISLNYMVGPKIVPVVSGDFIIRRTISLNTSIATPKRQNYYHVSSYPLKPPFQLVQQAQVCHQRKLLSTFSPPIMSNLLNLSSSQLACSEYPISLLQSAN